MQCDYIFVRGEKTDQPCGIKCRGESHKCSLHRVKEEHKQVLVNLSKNEKQREYMRKRRADPMYRTTEEAYQREYCKRVGISYRELVKLIDFPARKSVIIENESEHVEHVEPLEVSNGL